MEEGLRVLILEDVETDAELIQLQFETLGYRAEFVVTHKGDEYRQLLSSYKPDLVISDFTLPAFDGMRALNILRENDDLTPFIFVTGTLGEEKAVQAIKSGATDFIIKSHLHQLPAAIVRAMRERQEVQSKKENIQKLEDSENRFKVLVQKGSGLIAITDYSGKFHFVSQNYEAVLGFEPTDLLSVNFFDLIHEEDLIRVKASYNELNEKQCLELDPFRVQAAHTEWRWFQTIFTDMHTEPSIRGIVLNSRDVTELVAKEQELQMSNERYRMASIATHDLIYDYSIESDSIFIDNQTMKRMLGYDPQEIKSHAEFWKSNVHPDDLNQTLDALYEKVLDPTFPFYELEYRYRRADATYAYVHDKGHIIRNKNGKAIRLIGANRDITDQKNKELQQELMLNVSRSMHHPSGDLGACLKEVLEKLVNFIGVSVGEAWLPSLYSHEMNRLAIYTNDEKGALFHKKSDSLGLNISSDLVTKAWSSRRPEIWSAAATADSLRKQVVREVGLEAAYAVPIIYNDEVLSVFLFISEKSRKDIEHFEELLMGISHQLAPELQRKRAEDELNNFFRLSADMMCIVSMDGYLKKVNSAFTRVLGYSEDELLNRQAREFMHPDDRNSARSELKRLMSGKPTLNYENRYISKSGEVKWLSWSSSVVKEEHLVIATAKDITYQKAFQRRLLENTIRSQEEERNRIAKDLHDGIVQEIVGCSMKVDYLRHSLHDPNLLKPGIEELGVLLKKLAMDTRSVSHNLLSADMETMSFEALLERLDHKLNSFTPLFFKFNIHLEECRKIDRDIKVNLYRCIQELTNNIIKHADATNAYINLDCIADTLYLTVRDNGKGISAKKAPVGIGLSNLKERVFDMGGRLSLTNSDNGGLEVSIEVPLSDQKWI